MLQEYPECTKNKPGPWKLVERNSQRSICISAWRGQKCLRVDGQQPATNEKLVCISGRMTEVQSPHGLPEFPSGLNLQLPIVACGLITNALSAAFLSLPHFPQETRLSPAGISLLVRLLVRRPAFPGCPNSPSQDLLHSGE